MGERSVMITVPELAADALGSFLASYMHRRYGASETRLVELYVGEGERRWIQAVATRLPEQRRLLVLQDISELRRAEVARRDFVANVSHELRTPVAALKATPPMFFAV